MPLRVTCPECGASRDVNEDKRGTKVPCRKCEALIRVPAKSRPAAVDEIEDVEEVEEVEEVTPVKKKKPLKPVDEDEEPAPVKKKPRRSDEDDAVQSAPAKKKAIAPPAKSQKRRDDDYEEEEEERPRGKKGKQAKKRSMGATIAIAAVLIVVIVVSLGTAAYLGFRGEKDNNVANNNPQPAPWMQQPGGVAGPGMGMGGGGPGPGIPLPGGMGGGRPGGDLGTDINGGDKSKDPPKTTHNPPPVVSTGGGSQVSRGTVYNYVLKSAAWILTKHLEGGAMGSGSLIDRDNRLVLTNYHVVEGMVDFVVFFPVYEDNRLVSERNVYLAKAKREDAMKGKVVAHDKRRDLALIQLDKVPEGIEPLPFAKSDPAPGDSVHSIGNPGASDSLWVYTPGVVRSLGVKEWKAGGGNLLLDLKARVVETNSPTNPGDSGGPCVNDNGELIGVTQGGSRSANLIALFIAYTEAQDFIGQAFKQSPLLAGKSWSRSQRPTLVASGGGDTAKAPTLIAQLRNPDPVVRAAGAQGLGLLGPDAVLAIPELVKALGDADPIVRRYAGRSLRQAGQPSAKDFPDLLPDLLPSLDSPKPEARAYVLEMLALLGGNSTAGPGVLKAVDDPDASVRLQAVRAVGRMAVSDIMAEKDATAALEKGLADADRKVRGAAAESLADLPSYKTNLAKLTALLKHKEPEVSVQGVKAIARLGEKGKPAIPDLLDAARAENRVLRKAGFVALNAVNASPREMLPVLRNGLKDEDAEVRRAALVAAGNSGAAAKDLVPGIVDALADPDLRIPALSTLKKLGPEARDGAPNVANLLTTDPAMRKDTLETLEAMKLSGSTLNLVLPKLLALFGDEKQEPIRNKVAEVLASIGKPAIDPLCVLLRDQKPENRAGAATALGAMGFVAQGASNNLQLAIQKETDEATKTKELAALRSVNAVAPTKP
jgi:S1-C subfamily serine protease